MLAEAGNGQTTFWPGHLAPWEAPPTGGNRERQEGLKRKKGQSPSSFPWTSFLLSVPSNIPWTILHPLALFFPIATAGSNEQWFLPGWTETIAFHLPACSASSSTSSNIWVPCPPGHSSELRHQPWKAPPAEPWDSVLPGPSSRFLRCNHSNSLFIPPVREVAVLSCNCYFWDTWEFSLSFQGPSKQLYGS